MLQPTFPLFVSRSAGLQISNAETRLVRLANYQSQTLFHNQSASFMGTREVGGVRESGNEESQKKTNESPDKYIRTITPSQELGWYFHIEIGVCKVADFFYVTLRVTPESCCRDDMMSHYAGPPLQQRCDANLSDGSII